MFPFLKVPLLTSAVSVMLLPLKLLLLNSGVTEHSIAFHCIYLF